MNDIEKQETKENPMAKSKIRPGRKSSIIVNPAQYLLRKASDLNKFKITPSRNL